VNPLLIAEVKLKSPFGYKSETDFTTQLEFACKVGDWISIHTDPRWGGCMDQITIAFDYMKHMNIKKPILAKGLHQTDAEVEEALSTGADYALVVGRIPTVYNKRCIIEPTNIAQLLEIPRKYKIVWNSRDLRSGEDKPETFHAAAMATDSWLCQASGIRSIHGVHSDAKAVLVGEHLEHFIESIRKKNALEHGVFQ